MNMKAIKVGKWYETTQGIGECVRAGGTFPPSCQINIVHPFPRGALNFAPRDVKCEVPAPKQAP